MPRKLWTAPLQQFLTGDNAKGLGIIFRNLNEYFRTHIGFWGEYSGATDSNGRITFTHECGFAPAAATVTEIYVDTSAHDMGPFHIHSLTDTSIDLHFLTKSGQDRASHNVKVYAHFVPATS